jgi:hypothetical protein
MDKLAVRNKRRVTERAARERTRYGSRRGIGSRGRCGTHCRGDTHEPLTHSRPFRQPDSLHFGRAGKHAPQSSATQPSPQLARSRRAPQLFQRWCSGRRHSSAGAHSSGDAQRRTCASPPRAPRSSTGGDDSLSSTGGFDARSGSDAAGFAGERAAPHAARPSAQMPTMTVGRTERSYTAAGPWPSASAANRPLSARNDRPSASPPTRVRSRPSRPRFRQLVRGLDPANASRSFLRRPLATAA